MLENFGQLYYYDKIADDAEISRLGQNIHPSADKIKIVLFHLVAEKGVVDQVNPSRHGIPQAIYKPEGDALFDPHGIRGLEKVSKLYSSLLTID